MQHKTGFTLIEMLTVIMIISILTAVVLPQYRRAVQKAEASEAVAMLRVIHDSGERLAAEYGYKSFKSFSGSSSADKAKATLKRMDMFDTGTISCSFNSDYTEMTCEHFKYFLNKGGNYISATKRNHPYEGTQIRLYREDIPRITCVNAQDSDGCDLYNIATE